MTTNGKDIWAEFPDMHLVISAFQICGACLDGHGGMCNSPGCLFWKTTGPDLPIADRLRDMGCAIESLRR